MFQFEMSSRCTQGGGVFVRGASEKVIMRLVALRGGIFQFCSSVVRSSLARQPNFLPPGAAGAGSSGAGCGWKEVKVLDIT